MQITKNFSQEELVYSATAVKEGIKNIPTPEHLKNLTIMAVNILQRARAELGHAIRINSGYRSPELNKLIGGSKTSHHMRGMAVDVTSADNLRLWEILSRLDFTQLIWYYEGDRPEFIHIGYDKDNLKKERLYCYLESENGVYKRKYKLYS